MCAKCKPLYCICGCIIPQRFVVIFICVLGLLVSRTHKSRKVFEYACNVSGILPRDLHDRLRHSNDFVNAETENGTDIDKKADAEEADLVWRNAAEQIQIVLLSFGYSFGHWLAILPAGILSDIYGAKWFYCGSIASSSFITLFTPIFLNLNTPWHLMILVRILLGITQSAIYPCMAILVSHWTPVSRRALLGAICYSSYPFLNYLGDYSFLFMSHKGVLWLYLYYLPAGIGFLWCFLCVYFIHDSPIVHPHITIPEKKFLMEEIWEPTNLRLTFLKIIDDRGVWSLVLGDIGHTFILYILKHVLLKNGVSGDIPQKFLITTSFFFGLWPAGILSGFAVDYGVKKKSDVLTLRRLATSLGFLIPSGFLILSSYMKGEIITTALFFGLAIVFMGPHYAGHAVNHMDLTIHFNGTVIGLMSFITDMSVVVLGLLSGNVIAPRNNILDFHKEAWFSCGISFLFIVCYILMLRVTRSKWDIPPSIALEDLYQGFEPP